MKKRLLALIIAVFMTTSTAFAQTPLESIESSDSQMLLMSVTPRASDYLSYYAIAFGARDNCRMVITMDVNAPHIMNRIGCMTLVIEEKINGTWYECDTLVSADYPEFITTNSASYFHSIDYYGTAGVQYRVTMTAYARDDTGYDTGEVTSYVVTCRE